MQEKKTMNLVKNPGNGGKDAKFSNKSIRIIENEVKTTEYDIEWDIIFKNEERINSIVTT